MSKRTPEEIQADLDKNDEAYESLRRYAGAMFMLDDTRFAAQGLNAERERLLEELREARAEA